MLTCKRESSSCRADTPQPYHACRVRGLRALAPARVMTCEGESSSCRASVPCTAKSAMMTPLRGSSHLRPRGNL